MFFYEGQSCPVCGKAFAESDDIVACPQCGCPHHRACWREEGHCHFEADHGTEKQWGTTKTEEVKQEAPAAENRCPKCGGNNPEFAEFCGHCGNELPSKERPAPQYTPPMGGFKPPFTATPPMGDPYGGVAAGTEIEGVPVEEIIELVGPNSGYYLPRFFELSRKKSKVSWNLSAFLLTDTWLLYRKNVVFGIPASIVAILLSGIQEAVMTMQEASNLNPQTMQLLAIISFAVMVVAGAIRVLIGLFGNWLYMQQVLKQARKLRGDPRPLLQRGFFQKGGTSLVLALAPSIIVAILTYMYLFLSMMF